MVLRVARGVGHVSLDRDKEESFSAVGSADVAGSNESAFDAVSTPFEFTDKAVQPVCNNRRHVFEDDERWAELVDDADELTPESALGSVESGLFSGQADVRAW